MKKIFLLVALVVCAFTSFDAKAYYPVYPHSGWFKVYPQIFYGSTYIQARVYNNTAYRVACQGRVYGSTRSGHSLWSNFGPSYIPSFGYGVSYVYTNYYNTFVNGYADVYCRYY